MAYKDYIFVDVLKEAERHIEIKDIDGQSFINIQFSNEAFKELSKMNGFKLANNGFGFYFQDFDSKIMFKKSTKELFYKESLEVREQFYKIAKFIEKNVSTCQNKKNICPVCGYDEFGDVNITTTEGSSMFSNNFDMQIMKITYNVKFCCKCRSMIVLE